MKTMLIGAVLALCAGAAQAQTYQTQPNGVGGWNTFGSDGSRSQTLPNGVGGWNTFTRPAPQQAPQNPYYTPPVPYTRY